VSAEAQVLGAVDHTHAAGTEPVEDAVVRDNGTNHAVSAGEAFRQAS